MSAATSARDEPVWANENGTASGARSQRQPGFFAIGDVVDKRYELRRDIGRGAAGIVFEARHKFTGRRVALKVVSPEVKVAIVGELRLRLMREARALAAVRHPGIVDILDGGVASDGSPYIAMEMLDGRTLEGLLAARSRLPKEDAAGIALQICDALGAAHRVGVIHRDLKPGNVFLVRDGKGYERAKIVDFGIARVPTERHEPKLTGIGALLGTPEYMSPEQLLAFHEIDTRADVYAVGVTLYECLTGRVPYSGTYQQILLQTASPEPPPSPMALAPETGAALSEAVVRAIAKRREDRFASVADFAQAIQEAVPGARMRTRLLAGSPPPPPVRSAAVVSMPPMSPASAESYAASAETSSLYATRPEPAPAPPIDPAASTIQRRRAARAAYVTPVGLVHAGVTYEARNEDISEGGMLVIARTDAIEHGARLLVRFALPLEGRVVTCAADVRWVKSARSSDPQSPHALGVEFVDLSPEVRASIARYVEATANADRTT